MISKLVVHLHLNPHLVRIYCHVFKAKAGSKQRMLAVNEYQRVSWGQNLYRIGVLRDGSCLFHSLLMETDPNYHALSLKAKREAAVALRKKVATSLTIKDFYTMSNNGTPLHRDLPARVQVYQKEHYDVSSADIARISQELEKHAYELPTPTDKDLKEFLQKFLAFREYIANPEESVGDELHLLVSRVLEADVYLTTTEEDGGIGYILHDPELAYEGRRSVIVHKVQGKDHWEAVGQFSEQGLITLFEPGASVIRQLRKCFEDHWATLQH
jgi:hypothetical protein